MTSNPFDVGYYTEHDLRAAGFKAIGENVRIAKNCTIIGLDRIEIGDNVRIDGYTSLIAADGMLRIGSFVHIGSYSLLSAGDGITMQDFSGLSQGVRIYSRTDDYTGKHLTNPTVPSQFTGVNRGPVELGRHVIIGSQTVILPNIVVGEGSAVGAISLVTKSLESWGVYFGIPAKRLRARSKELLSLEAELMQQWGESSKR
jgi:acetyltransferase-like isoleucine patch superfamily enzyme